MSFIRPDLQASLFRFREVIAGGTIALVGLWIATRGGWLLTPFGLALAALGAVWAILALRRLRFQQEGEAPGIVRVTEAQVAYLGPRIGGFIGLPDLTEVRLLSFRGRRVWKLRSATGEALHIPVEAEGAEALFDAFAGLPGMDTAALVAALGSQGPGIGSGGGPGAGNVIALDGADRLIWARKGSGIVGR